MDRFRIENSSDRLRQYLLSSGYLEKGESAVITRLGGGVANDVFKVESSTGAAVFKQALSRIRVKSRWIIDAQRSNVEKDALKLMRRILGPEHVPAVLFEDEENFIFGIELAPEGSQEWKTRLLGGEVDFGMAGQVARLLARIHNETFESEEVMRRFDQQQRFLECRVSPYFETIARRHPSLAGPERFPAAPRGRLLPRALPRRRKWSLSRQLKSRKLLNINGETRWTQTRDPLLKRQRNPGNTG